MKIHHFLLAAALSAFVTMQAQWPTCISFNTANNNLGGVVGVWNADNNWRCSPTFAGPYTLIPRQVPLVTGWHTGSTAPFFPCDADWISYPHTCNPNDIREDHCGCQTDTVCTDDFYEYQFNLPPGGPYTLPLTMMADNCIAKVWLNGFPVYTAPAVQTAPGPSNYGGYLFAGFQAGNQVNLNITSPFIPGGMNSLKVQVLSGINTLGVGWTGFVCFNRSCVQTRKRDDGGIDPTGNDPLGLIKSNGDQAPLNENIELKQAAAQSNSAGSSINTVVLKQNVPNPFAESTVITYVIPADFKKAQLVFRNNQGTVMKTIDITRAGKGSVTVYADDLSNGLYTYNLVIEDRVVESKKMMKN
jgi:hypothetical protein